VLLPKPSKPVETLHLKIREVGIDQKKPIKMSTTKTMELIEIISGDERKYEMQKKGSRAYMKAQRHSGKRN
jgi:hypothetical protein